MVAHSGAAVFGGAEKATALLLAGLQVRGHYVVIYCRDAERVAGFAAYGLDARVLSLGGDFMVHNAWRFARVLRHYEPDVVLLTTFRKIWLAALGARLARTAVVAVRVGLSSDTPRNMKYKFALRHWVDLVVMNSEATASAWRAILPDTKAREVVTLHTGVPRPVMRGARGEVRRYVKIPNNAVVIGALARLSDQKRLDRLLEAMVALPDNVHCIIAGAGPLRAQLARHARELGVDARVHWLGHRDDVGDVLDALDVLVITSDREGLSNAMLEAMSLGIPVVSTDVSGAREALYAFPDGTAPGVVVPMETAEIAAALKTLVRDSRLRKQMGAAGARRWREEFDYDRMLNDWETVLLRACRGETQIVRTVANGSVA